MSIELQKSSSELLSYNLWPGVTKLQSRPVLENATFNCSLDLCAILFTFQIIFNQIYFFFMGRGKMTFYVAKNIQSHWYFTSPGCTFAVPLRKKTNKKFKYKRIVENLKPHNNGICQSLTEEHISENIRKDFELDKYYFQNKYLNP